MTAGRRGLKTALVQDRPVLGGNNSSEVRVWLSGKTRIPPFTELGRVTDEFEQSVRDIFGPGNRAENYEDDHKRGILVAESNLTLYTGFSVTGADTADSCITGVWLYDVHTGQTRRLEAALYADCTGDAVLGAAAGAQYEMTTSGHMEMSNFWNIDDTAAAASPMPVGYRYGAPTFRRMRPEEGSQRRKESQKCWDDGWAAGSSTTRSHPPNTRGIRTCALCMAYGMP
jgi:hypothetical protein